jgi:hypothetical protein
MPGGAIWLAVCQLAPVQAWISCFDMTAFCSVFVMDGIEY